MHAGETMGLDLAVFGQAMIGDVGARDCHVLC